MILSERDQLAEEKSECCGEGSELQVQKEQILLLTQENRSLQDKLDSLQKERDQLRQTIEETISMVRKNNLIPLVNLCLKFWKYL